MSTQSDVREDAGRPGSLTVVGTGIRLVGQTTAEAKASIEGADKVLALVADPATMYWLTTLNASVEFLDALYDPAKLRSDTYAEMVDSILSHVRQGLDVCVASYGHPGVFAYPTHESVRRARAEGFPAVMLPGVSAEDCLFADLGVDPGALGCQSFEATDFLIHARKFDENSSLVLWQVGVIAERGYKEEADAAWNVEGLRVLADVLRAHYGADHEVVVYEAAQYPTCAPVMLRVPLSHLPDARVTWASTLYVPPRGRSVVDRAMMERLGLSPRPA